jgi:hypothetical protein
MDQLVNKFKHKAQKSTNKFQSIHVKIMQICFSMIENIKSLVVKCKF